ncbi:unnamed protein product [Brassica oleracea]
MAHYNTLGEVVYNNSLTCWRFRVKILRIHLFYSYVTSGGSHWVYILADEDLSENTSSLKGLEKQEAKWVEIFRVEVGNALPGFKETNSPYTLTAAWYTQYRIIDLLNNQYYIMCLTYGGLSDFRFNPRLEEVEEFWQSLNNNDSYVRRHEAVGPL